MDAAMKTIMLQLTSGWISLQIFCYYHCFMIIFLACVAYRQTHSAYVLPTFFFFLMIFMRLIIQ